MNEYNDPNAAFDGIINSNGLGTNPQVNTTHPYTGPHQPYSPYGPAPHPAVPVKTGLTKRGKTALTLGAVVLAGGALITYQHHADTSAANALKAKQIQIQQDKLNLEKQQAAAKANQAAQTAQAKAEAARQAKVDACINTNKGLVGKQLGYRMSDVIDDCQKQYPDTTTTGSDMQEAASTHNTNNSSGEGLLIGAGVLLVGGFVIAVRKTGGSRQQAAGPQMYVPYYPPQQ